MGDINGRGWLRSAWGRMFGHDRCWREGLSSAADRHGGFVGGEVKWRGRRTVGDGSLVCLVGRKRKDLMFYGRPFWNERKNRKAGIMVVCQRKILFFFSPIFNLRVACRKDCALLRS